MMPQVQVSILTTDAVDTDCKSLENLDVHSDFTMSGGHSLQPCSSQTSIVSRPVMDVVCVIDVVCQNNLALRKAALEEVKAACQMINATLSHLQFEKIDYGDSSVLSKFYTADVAIVDLSFPEQRTTLFYHLGVRESFELTQKILIMTDLDADSTMKFKLSCNDPITSYTLTQNDTVCHTTGDAQQSTLHVKLKKSLQETQIQTKEYIKKKFMSDLEKLPTEYSGEELRNALHNIRKRLDDPNVLNSQNIQLMLYKFRDVQDYDAMVHLYMDLSSLSANMNINDILTHSVVEYLYAFALNRRMHEGDREKALEICEKALNSSKKNSSCSKDTKDTKEAHADMICLCGRIYKDLFIESNHTDTGCLEKAIHWYRKGFDANPNVYAGVNLATLLVIKGEDIHRSTDLERIGIQLNNLLGKKGSLESLKEYWDVATFFEISVLFTHYANAIQAAECMFNLKPPDWYLKSTIRNLSLIDMFRKRDEVPTPEEQVFHFWMEFFQEGSRDPRPDCIRFPVLIRESTREFMPSYVCVNLDTENQTLQIENICLKQLKNNCSQIHNWVFDKSMIRTLSLYKKDERSIILYIYENADDFHVYFPSVACRILFQTLIMQAADVEELVDRPQPVVDFDYELDEQGKRKVLGKGTYGVVYAARDNRTQTRIAVKEIHMKNAGAEQPLHEEISLHFSLRHRNIVQYLGSHSEGDVFKIIMEQVPGGSLSALLRSHWGPLKSNEQVIAHYTKQILEGLKYLHDQKIVHRDIKGDNVLVNTYNGTIKISDFGTSKRLHGLCPITETFAGTLQYMAPEVIDKGQRGYGPPADIWSVGCTVVEMATGKPPFVELGSPQAAIFKVGFYKAHPEVPEELSNKAQSFILRCFEPDPDKRATASELLEDLFLGERKKSVRLTTDFNRSVSVPADRLQAVGRQGHKSAPNQSPTSPPVDSQTRGTLAPIQMPSTSSLTFSSLATTPSVDMDTDTTDLNQRRSSSGTLQSPDVDASGENDGFYMLKKDSQRRLTLAKALLQDGDLICNVWIQKVQSTYRGGEAVVKRDHLVLLLHGLREYISEPSQSLIEIAIGKLKQELGVDTAIMQQIQFAIYLLEEAVIEVLRLRPIKPHWMFALAGLVRGAIQAAISVLAPELVDEADIQHQSTSNTLYSTTSSKAIPPSYDNQALREENLRLQKELAESYRQYQFLVKQLVENNNIQAEALRRLASTVTNAIHIRRIVDPEIIIDQCLSQWLYGLDLPVDSVRILQETSLTLNEVLYQLNREDLQMIGLPFATEFRVWRAITQHRRAGGVNVPSTTRAALRNGNINNNDADTM